jgi:hypothetical protein
MPNITAKTPRAQREEVLSQTRAPIDEIADLVVVATLMVPHAFGSGWLESKYQACLTDVRLCQGIDD